MLSAVKAELKEKNAQVTELMAAVERLRGAKGELEEELEEVQGVSDLALACLEETAAELEATKTAKEALEFEVGAKGAEVERLRRSVASYVAMGAKTAMDSEAAEEKRAAEAAAKEASLTRQLDAARVALRQLKSRQAWMSEKVTGLEAKHAGVCRQKAALEVQMAEMAVAFERKSAESMEAEVGAVLEALVMECEAAVGQREAVVAVEAKKAAEAMVVTLEAQHRARETELVAADRAMAGLRAEVEAREDEMEVLVAEVERLRRTSVAVEVKPTEVQELSNALVWLERTADQLAGANAKISALQADKRALEAMVAQGVAQPAVC
jgi:chromosome segregation ATPase